MNKSFILSLLFCLFFVGSYALHNKHLYKQTFLSNREQSEANCLPLICLSGRVSKGLTVSTNGCSVASWVPNPGFTSCCNSHDSCYGNCGDLKISCDAKFWSCMINTCNSKYSKWYQVVQRTSCKALATTYYASVTVGGICFYNNAQTKYCRCR